MGYTVRVERLGANGTPQGVVTVYEVEGEAEAVALAADEVDLPPFPPRRIASVFDDAGDLVLAYYGRRTAMGDRVGAGDAGR